MEGVFYGKANVIHDTYIKKCKYKICSFSAEKDIDNPLEKPFENPSMWGYYANAFKGMIIEIVVDEDKVRKIDYDDKIANLDCLRDSDSVEKILKTKSTAWKREVEHRFLIGSENNYHKVGDIVAVHFGDPYGNTQNKATIYKASPALESYEEFKNKLIKVADDKKIDRSSVSVKDGKVVKGSNLPCSCSRNGNETER